METERAVRIKIYARGVDAAAQNMYIYIERGAHDAWAERKVAASTRIT